MGQRGRVPLTGNHWVGTRPVGAGVGHGKPPTLSLQVVCPFPVELVLRGTPFEHTVEQHACLARSTVPPRGDLDRAGRQRSEEHTSELQSQSNLVCRLLLEKKKNNK